LAWQSTGKARISPTSDNGYSVSFDYRTEMLQAVDMTVLMDDTVDYALLRLMLSDRVYYM